MPNITIQKKNSNSFRVNFNDYSSNENINSKTRSYCTCDIVELELNYSEDHINVQMRDTHEVRQWDVTYDSTYNGTDFFIIDSVDLNDGNGSQAPQTQLELFDLLESLRG